MDSRVYVFLVIAAISLIAAVIEEARDNRLAAIALAVVTAIALTAAGMTAAHEHLTPLR